MFRFTIPAVVACAIGALAIAPGALAAPPAAEELNPPPPDFLTCKALGAGTICSGSAVEVKESELQPELVCGSGADAFNIYDQGTIYQRVTRWYNADGDLTRRVIRERLEARVLEQPAQRQDGPVHTEPEAHDGARCAGRLRLGHGDNGGREHLHGPGYA